LTLFHTLESPELEIETAVNGEEALSKMKEKTYNIILLDLKMPGIGGIDVLREVHQKYPENR